MAGGVAVNFSPLAPIPALKFQLADSEVRVIVTLGSRQLYPRVSALKGTASLETLVVCSLEDFSPAPSIPGFSGPAAERAHGLKHEIEFTALISNDGLFVRHPHCDLSDEVAMLQYTGGTTGDPKGAMLTHANFCAAVHAYVRLGWGGDPVAGSDLKRLIVMPLCHIVGLTCGILVAVATGAELIVHLRFDPSKVLEDISRKRIVIFSGVPSMYAMLSYHSRIREHDLSSLRYCACGGAPLPIEILDRFRSQTGVVPRDGYGLTETTTAGASHPIDREPRPGTVGLPTPGIVLDIVDLEDGTEAQPRGTPGEICMTGPQVMKGYWKRPDDTAAAFYGGRFHTGDIGFIDQDGYLALVDRKKDLILSGGYNVFPRNVEEAIYQHPAVAEVVVIGVPSKFMGQEVKAFITLKPDASPPDHRELARFLTERLAAHEIPSEIETVASLPKTAVGKPSKKLLLETHLAKRSGTIE
jgi:long-chain acyl-CoA synthetase